MPRHTPDAGTKLEPQSAQGRTPPQRQTQPGERGPASAGDAPEWRDDLNPSALAGQNIGPASADREKRSRTLHDLKDLHRRYSGLADDDLRQIPVLDTGLRLKQGATYFDLNDTGRGEFVANGEMLAGQQNAYVPNAEVPYQLWNRLIGVDNPERVGEADEGASDQATASSPSRAVGGNSAGGR